MDYNDNDSVNGTSMGSTLATDLDGECLYVCVCLHAYVHMFACVCIDVCMCLRECVSVCAYTHVCVCVFVCKMQEYMLVCFKMSVNMPVCMFTHVHKWV